MVTKTITEQRAEVRIFAGNDPAHTATGSSGISSATPALTTPDAGWGHRETGGLGRTESR